MTQSTHLTIESMAAVSRPDGHASWARTQVETAANFAEDSVFWFVMSGGLNVQVSQQYKCDWIGLWVLLPVGRIGWCRRLTIPINTRHHNQVEHHLFPALSHGALRKLTPVIRSVCRDHGVHFK